MIASVCKYTPDELFAGFGESCQRINPTALAFDLSDQYTHPNLCSFAKALLQSCLQGGVEELLLTECCDSLRRVGDVLKQKLKFVYLLDLPHDNNGVCAVDLYAGRLLDLIYAYETYSGEKFDIAAFKAALPQAKETISQPYISIMGARINDELYHSIAKMAKLPVKTDTCTGVSKGFTQVPKTEDLQQLMRWYAHALLRQNACLRMENIADRNQIWNDPHLKGVIYHTVKFCDFYGFEYAKIRNKGVPIVKIETEYTPTSDGQIRTRIEAFMEGLTPQKQKSHSIVTGYTAGMDSGSTSTNVVILDKDCQIVSYAIVPTGARSLDGAYRALEQALQKAGLKKEDINRIVSTGYGRISINFADQDVTEITCHAKGVYFLDSSVRTIIDIGGQDSKVIRLDEEGNVTDFVMNDKCAAGTGRFLDMMARTLEMDLGVMSKLGLQWNEEIVISSMCTVFAESEVISLIAQNKEIPDIVHGLNQSVASKIYALVKRVQGVGPYMMTGGVANNKGVVRAIEEKLGQPLLIWQIPDLCGALGAALLAKE